jgi:multiple sugar transport system permease protein
VKRATRTSILLHVAAWIVAICALAPFSYMVLASVTPQRSLITTPLRWIPSTLDFSRYVTIFQGGAGSAGATFRAAMLNSTVVAVGTVAVSMVVGVLGAYAFARLRFRFRRAVLMLFHHDRTHLRRLCACHPVRAVDPQQLLHDHPGRA